MGIYSTHSRISIYSILNNSAVSEIFGAEKLEAWNLGPRKGDAKQLHDWKLADAAAHFATSGASVAVATAITHPLDVIKVRLQMQFAGQRGQLIGMSGVFANIVKHEGPTALYSGLVPALSRSLVYGGLRLSLYEPCKYLCDRIFDSTNILFKITSGAISGAIATTITNPMEVLKVRLQMSSNPQKGPIKEMRKIVSEEGVIALWKGIGPAMIRASCLTASQLATYDESKQALLKWTPLEEGFHLHLISSCIAGSVGTVVTAPVDTIKTRLMLQQDTGSVRSYKNGFHCAYQIVLTEGFGALYKGLSRQIKTRLIQDFRFF